VVSIIAAHQAAQAIKLLSGNVEALDRSLLSIDVWSNETRRFDISGARSEACPCCGRGEFQFLEGGAWSVTTSLCGRNAVQITPARGAPARIDLAEFAGRLSPHGDFTHNEFILRGNFKAERSANGEPIELTLFSNGRAIIKGTSEPEAARSIYAKYIGS
jgi:adenylyltransferase/sulfurtransferase